MKKDENAIVSMHLHFVWPIVHRLALQLPESVDKQTLYSVGMGGLLHAIRRYDPNRVNAAPFIPFACLTIRRAMLSEIRRAHWRNELPLVVTKVNEVIEYEYQKDFTDEVSRKELRTILLDALAGLCAVQEQVLLLYYFHDLKLKLIGNLLGLTDARICQIHVQALTAMRLQFESLH